MIKLLIEKLRLPEIDVASNRLTSHEKAIQSKKVFRDLVKDIQLRMWDFASQKSGVSIEIGSGVIPMKLNIKKVLASDIVDTHSANLKIDAQRMNLSDNSVDQLFLQNVFHHIGDPNTFFSECIRVLHTGGRVVIVEPYHNLLSRMVYSRIFQTEHYDTQGNWNNPMENEMLGANQALSFIVFARDSEKYQLRYPNLKVIHKEYLPFGLRYLCSGGLNFRQLMPERSFRLIKHIDRKFAAKTALHWMIVLEKQ